MLCLSRSAGNGINLILRSKTFLKIAFVIEKVCLVTHGSTFKFLFLFWIFPKHICRGTKLWATLVTVASRWPQETVQISENVYRSSKKLL